jgi:chromosome segregation ATPase
MDNMQVATKADLIAVKIELKTDIKAIKSDVKSLKSDVKSLKSEVKSLKSEVKSLRQDFLKLEARVENLEEGQERILVILKRMENTLDGFVGRVDNLTTDNEVGTHQTREIQVRVDDHEKRLRYIESLKHTA